jgi:hypothetical protein
MKKENIDKEIAYWNDVKRSAEGEIDNLEKALKFNKAVLEMAVSKIQNEA